MRTRNIAGHASLTVLLERRTYKITINFNFFRLDSLLSILFAIKTCFINYYSVIALNVYLLTVKMSIFDNGDSGEPYVSSHLNTRCAVRDPTKSCLSYSLLIN